MSKRRLFLLAVAVGVAAWWLWGRSSEGDEEWFESEGAVFAGPPVDAPPDADEP